jgi:hypothetical protein
MTVQHHSPRASRTRRTSHPATVPDPGAVDARLAGLLESKPADDPIPLSAWWFVATTLQSAVVVRRVMEGVEPAPARGIGHEVTRAQAAARAALEELDERAVEPHTSSDRPFLRMATAGTRVGRAREVLSRCEAPWSHEAHREG